MLNALVSKNKKHWQKGQNMSKRPPIAFMSYARSDDENMKGSLTRFREHLSDAVEVVTGEEFQIFQDRDDIKWGQNWKKRIQNSLDEITFLIPIITPRFFKSEYCRDEVERFIGREKELKRDDLILPVYYVSCKQMDDESKRSSDPIAVKIKEHNWTDWRELRFESFDSGQVQKNLAELAEQIRDALERVAEVVTQQSDSDAEAVQEKSKSESEKQDSKQKKTNASPNERSTPTIDEKIPKKDYENSIGIKFVLIQPGEFMMGSEEMSWEKPVHKVTVSKPFYLGIYPVTQKEWKAMMENNPSYFKGDNLPVERVSWNEVQEFIKKLNEKEGTNKYRLPSEAEWEYAARAGTTTRYSFDDNDESKLDEYAWYESNSGGKTHEVGKKKPNPWGLYDMHGNVWEWVQDIWHGDYNGAPTDGSSWEGDGSSRVNRGGGWNNSARACRSARRAPYDPGYRVNAFGFRLLRIL